MDVNIDEEALSNLQSFVDLLERKTVLSNSDVVVPDVSQCPALSRILGKDFMVNVKELTLRENAETDAVAYDSATGFLCGLYNHFESRIKRYGSNLLRAGSTMSLTRYGYFLNY